MKRSILTLTVSALTAGLLLLSSFTTQAQALVRSDVKKMVVKAVDYPENAVDKKLQGEVVVSFVPTKDGKLEVKEIFSRVPELRDYVYKTITDLEVPKTGDVFTEPIVLRFTFKLL